MSSSTISAIGLLDDPTTTELQQFISRYHYNQHGFRSPCPNVNVSHHCVKRTLPFVTNVVKRVNMALIHVKIRIC